MPRFLIALICLLLLPPAGGRALGQSPQFPSPNIISGSISGTVSDTDEAEIPGALISLQPAIPSSSALRIIANAAGQFTIPAVPPGSYTVSVSFPGFATINVPANLHPGEELALADIVLPVASSTETIQVRPSRFDMAEPDVIAAEHQRLGGFVPNFYVTYDRHAPPLAARQKFTLAWRTAFDPANFVISAAIAGVEQATNTFPGYHQGAAGYGKRLGAATADLTSGTFIGGAILPALFHQDPRYFYKPTGSILSRTLYALATAVVCRGDNGRWQPNYSSVIGDVASGAISNLYYPSTDRNGVTLTIENGLLNAAEDGVGNLIQQFVFRRISPNLPPPKP